MSQLTSINAKLRISAIKTVLRNYPALLEEVINEDGSFNTKATPEALCCIDPADTLLSVAWDIWNGGGEAELDKILNVLPSADFDAFIDAMKEYGRLRKKIEDMHSSNQQSD